MSKFLRLSEAQFLALSGVAPPPPEKKQKQGISQISAKGPRTIGGKTYNFRSLWEINFAHYLQLLKSTREIDDWFYEGPDQLFKFPKDDYDTGPFQYLVDFKVIGKNQAVTYFEVKGFLDPNSKRRIKRFRKHYPDLSLTIIDGAWFKANNKRMRQIIPNWERAPFPKKK